MVVLLHDKLSCVKALVVKDVPGSGEVVLPTSGFQVVFVVVVVVLER